MKKHILLVAFVIPHLTLSMKNYNPLPTYFETELAEDKYNKLHRALLLKSSEEFYQTLRVMKPNQFFMIPLTEMNTYISEKTDDVLSWIGHKKYWGFLDLALGVGLTTFGLVNFWMNYDLWGIYSLIAGAVPGSILVIRSMQDFREHAHKPYFKMYVALNKKMWEEIKKGLNKEYEALENKNKKNSKFSNEVLVEITEE